MAGSVGQHKPVIDDLFEVQLVLAGSWIVRASEGENVELL